MVNSLLVLTVINFYVLQEYRMNGVKHSTTPAQSNFSTMLVISALPIEKLQTSVPLSCIQRAVS